MEAERDPALRWYDGYAVSYDSQAQEIDESAKFMDTLTGPLTRSGSTVLDIGCGTGLSSQELAKKGVLVDGIDGSQSMLDRFAEKGLTRNLVLQDINEKPILPFPEAVYDLVVSNAVVNFIRNFHLFLAEAARVLKPNGWLCFSFEKPFDQEGKDYLVRDDGSMIAKDIFEKKGIVAHLRQCTEVELLLVQFGFTDIAMTSHFAFKSPNTNRDVYFTFVKARKTIS